MTKEDIKTLLMIITTLIVPILSLGIISPFIKIIFVLTYICICFLLLSKLFDDKLKMKKAIIIVAIAIEILFIVISALNAGSIRGFIERIRSSYVVSQNTSDINTISSDIDFETYFYEINEQLSEMDKKVEDSNSAIIKLDDSLSAFTSNLEDIHFNTNINEIEINEIVNLIEEYYENHKNSFSELRTDIYSIELFYKMYIAEETYYYCNILEAFERFGINNEKFEIDENILYIWDVEILYSIYNMQKKNYYNMCLDENAMGESFYYNNYRVNFKKYSDTFDYGNWRRDLEEYTAKEVEDILDEIIMGYYKKFIINFSVK